MRHYNSFKRSQNSRDGSRGFYGRANEHFEPRYEPRQTSRENPALKKFKETVAIDPKPRIRLEDGSNELSMRVMDLIAPIGRGQRGLIVAPPGSGKTTFLKQICNSVIKSSPDIKVYCLLIDERPEEVTDFRRGVQADVRWSSTDETYGHHIETADKLMNEIYEEVLMGKHIMLLVDSLTRLSRVHNAERSSGGRTLSGGVDARALEIPRRIFGSARCVENGGSLTILATVLVDTGSRMDQIIFEEFKGTGNMEIFLSREISNQRIFPAVDILKSGTRKEELLFTAEELEPIRKTRRVLAGMKPTEAIAALLTQLKKHSTNREFLQAIEKIGK